jgi:hypothetical protein
MYSGRIRWLHCGAKRAAGRCHSALHSESRCFSGIHRSGKIISECVACLPVALKHDKLVLDRHICRPLCAHHAIPANGRRLENYIQNMLSSWQSPHCCCTNQVHIYPAAGVPMAPCRRCHSASSAHQHRHLSFIGVTHCLHATA